jgi:cystathionine beta-synthase
VVTFVCDSGNKYLSKVYNDYWMLDQGFLERERFGDLRDLIVRRHWEHASVTVGANEPATAAYRRMKLYDVSQLPVMRDGKIVGIVDEEDILMEVFEHSANFDEPVSKVMESHLVTVPTDASLAQLMEIFKRGMVAIVMDKGEYLGLITRIDLLNWLRRRLPQ